VSVSADKKKLLSFHKNLTERESLREQVRVLQQGCRDLEERHQALKREAVEKKAECEGLRRQLADTQAALAEKDHSLEEMKGLLEDTRAQNVALQTHYDDLVLECSQPESDTRADVVTLDSFLDLNSPSGSASKSPTRRFRASWPGGASFLMSSAVRTETCSSGSISSRERTKCCDKGML